MRSAACAITLILLAACARSEDASTLPADNNILRPVEQVRSTDREDSQVAIGEWRASLQDEARALEFGPAGAPPLFSLRCDARRGVVLQRHGVPPSGDLPMMIVTIGNDTRRLAVTSGTGTIPMLRATVAARDPLLATLAQDGSPITIRVGDSPPLILPPSPTIGEFVSLCASGDGQGPEDEGSNVSAPENGSESAEPPTTGNEAAPSR